MDRRRRRRRSCRFCSSIAILVRARACAFLVGGGAAWGTQLPPREFALEPPPPPPNLYIVRIYTYAQRAVCSMVGRFFFYFPLRRVVVVICASNPIYIFIFYFFLFWFSVFLFFLYFYHLPVYVYSVCVCRSRIQLYSTHFIALYRHPPPTFIRSSSNGNRAQSFYIHHKYRVRSTVVSNSTPSTNPCILQ